MMSFPHSLLPAALLVAACGGPGPGDDGTTPDAASIDAPQSSDPKAPRFLSFGTNVTAITEGESVVFTAVLTDPDGIDDLIGGSLTSPDGSVTYGAFATSGQEGSYTITLTWAQLQQIDDITFRTMESRQFRAEFFDVAGHAVERAVSISLQCGSYGACSGRCAAACEYLDPVRVSCDAACAMHQGTCYANDTDRRAFYRQGGLQEYDFLDTCASVPAATSGGLPFAAVECVCVPSDP
ncbi:MAG TPA: hypothetical protein VM513_11640 [Kofleriaceae bacterium]|jgi:hypothetical protein|nr:hypothetical protein [Kofleriaceae bacterium]